MPQDALQRHRSMGDPRMKITVVGAGLILASAVVAILVIRALTNQEGRASRPDSRGNG